MREIKFRSWDGTSIIYSGDWPNLCGFFGTRSKDEKIMQFTGLKDKNGKEIYSGDILEYGGARNEVKYITELAMYDDIFGLGFASLAGQSEVVGNIYENLLNK